MRVKKKRLILGLLALALILGGCVLLNPYPRQLLLGPKIAGRPLCAWQECFRRSYGDEIRDESFFERFLGWTRHGKPSLRWDSLAPEQMDLVLVSLTDDRSPRVRRQVAVELSMYSKSRDVFAALLQLLDDKEEEVRASAADSIVDADYRNEALPHFHALLRHPDSSRRMLGLKSIQSILRQSEETLRMLVTMLDDSDATVRRTAARYLGSWGRKKVARIALPKLMKGLEDPDAGFRLEAARAAWNIERRPNKVLHTVRKELSNADEELRKIALWYWLEMENDWSDQAFATMWTLATADVNEAVRDLAVSGLGKFGKKSVPSLLAFLDHAKGTFSRTAILSLASLGVDAEDAAPILIRRYKEFGEPAIVALNAIKSAQAIPVYLAMLQDPDEGKLALIGLGGNLGPEAKLAIPHVFPLLKHSDHEVRWRALGTLGKLGAEPQLLMTTLEELLNDPKTLDGLGASDCLGNMGPWAKAAIPILTPHLKQSSTQMRVGERHTRFLCAWALGDIGAEARPAVADLLRLLSDADWGVRFSAAQALGKIGHDAPNVVPALVPLLNDKQEVVRRHAIKSLGLFGPQAKQAIPSLVQILEDDDEESGEAAFAALAKIDPQKYQAKKPGS